MFNKLASLLPANIVLAAFFTVLFPCLPAAFSQPQRPSGSDLIPFTNRWTSPDYKAPDLLSILGCDAARWKPRISSTLVETLGGFNIAYDSARDRIVLFFGVDDSGSNLISETWEWDGTNWETLAVGGPEPRVNQSMIYDSSHSESILFGGQGYDEQHFFMKMLGDTWGWNGDTWSQKQTAHSPSPRAGHDLAFRSLAGDTVLFGGDKVDSLDYSGPFLNDTWTWDGADWSQASPLLSPPPRSRHAMVYDSHRDRVVLYGGQGGSGILGDTWEWDGSSWLQINTAVSPPPLRAHAMAYDSERQKVVLYGGELGIGFSYETWEYDGTNWAKIKAGNPPVTDSVVMTYDSLRKECFLFSGEPPVTNFVYDGKPNCTE